MRPVTSRTNDNAMKFIQPAQGEQTHNTMPKTSSIPSGTTDILKALDEAGIGIASATFEIVGLPPIRIREIPDARSAPDDQTKD